MHDGGEVDIRGIYCALAISRLTGIYSDELFANTEHWILWYVRPVMSNAIDMSSYLQVSIPFIASFHTAAKLMKVVLVVALEWKLMADIRTVD